MAYQNMYGSYNPYNQYNPYPNQNSNPYYQGNSYNYSNYGNYSNQGNQQVQQPVQQQINSGFQWVQGEAAAKAFHVEPGQTVLLMDSDSPVLYFKSSDASGRPIPMIIYDLVERKENQLNNANQAIDLSAYLKRDEVEGLINDIVEKSVAKKVGELKSQQVPTVMPVSSLKTK